MIALFFLLPTLAPHSKTQCPSIGVAFFVVDGLFFFMVGALAMFQVQKCCKKQQILVLGAWGAGLRRLRAGFAVIYYTFELENEREKKRTGTGTATAAMLKSLGVGHLKSWP